MNDSFIDLDVISRRTGPEQKKFEASQYTKMVRNARKRRREADGGEIDWIVVRNRLSSIQANNKLKVASELDEVADRIGFRVAEGFGERVIYRELFPSGFNLLDKGHLGELGTSHLVARQEMRSLLARMHLPEIAKAEPTLELA